MKLNRKLEKEFFLLGWPKVSRNKFIRAGYKSTLSTEIVKLIKKVKKMHKKISLLITSLFDALPAVVGFPTIVSCQCIGKKRTQ